MDAAQFQDLKQRVDEIHTALIGSDIAKDGGMVSRLKHVEEKVEQLNEFKDKSKWTATILIGFAGVLGWVAEKIIDLFSKH